MYLNKIKYNLFFRKYTYIRWISIEYNNTKYIRIHRALFAWRMNAFPFFNIIPLFITYVKITSRQKQSIHLLYYSIRIKRTVQQMYVCILNFFFSTLGNNNSLCIIYWKLHLFKYFCTVRTHIPIYTSSCSRNRDSLYFYTRWVMLFVIQV